MVILIKNYECKYERFWYGGDPRPRWYVSELIACWNEFVVVSMYDIRKVEYYVNG